MPLGQALSFLGVWYPLVMVTADDPRAVPFAEQRAAKRNGLSPGKASGFHAASLFRAWPTHFPPPPEAGPSPIDGLHPPEPTLFFYAPGVTVSARGGPDTALVQL